MTVRPPVAVPPGPGGRRMIGPMPAADPPRLAPVPPGRAAPGPGGGTPQVPDLRAVDDPLAGALHQLRPAGVVYCHSELGGRWGLQLPPMPGCLMFHAFLRGDGWLLCDGQAPRRLAAGGVALVTRGAGHRMLAEPSLAGEPLFELGREPVARWFERLRLGDGAAAEAICGAVRLDDPVGRDLVQSLPTLIAVDDIGPNCRDWLRSSLSVLAAEAAGRQPGGEAMVTRLADILVIQVIRAWLEAGQAGATGWLRGLGDRHIGPALVQMHTRPAERWTVEQLAREAGLSRTAFAERFLRRVGETPLRHLTRWRMQLAQARLREEPVPLARLAAELGYESEASFSRAFRRVCGLPPGAMARGQSADPGAAIQPPA